jgi:thiosulfate reductase cytochrome b subunit
MNSPQTRDFLCNLKSDEVAQEFWATRNNAWVLVLPVLAALILVVGALVAF